MSISEQEVLLSMIQQYYMPAQVITGTNCIQEKSMLLKSLGQKALIVTGRQSARLNGSLEDTLAALKTNGQDYALFDQVMSNPTIACVYAGADIARSEKVDFVIALGGGSPMDAAKAIALLACQDIPEEALFSGTYGKEVLPMVLVPTTAGTGSEVTQYSVLTNDRLQTKTTLSAPHLFPRYAFLDARYTLSLPYITTLNTAMDALSHAIEGMLTKRASGITDILAAESIRKIFSCLRILSEEKPPTLTERDQLLQAAMLGGMVIANAGTTAVHALGYSLTYFKGIDHGRANGLLLASFLSFVEKTRPERVAQILKQTGLLSTAAFKAEMDRLLGAKEPLSTDEIVRYCDIAMKTRSIANSLVSPGIEDLMAMFRNSIRV